MVKTKHIVEYVCDSPGCDEKVTLETDWNESIMNQAQYLGWGFVTYKGPGTCKRFCLCSKHKSNWNLIKRFRDEGHP